MLSNVFQILLLLFHLTEWDKISFTSAITDRNKVCGEKEALPPTSAVRLSGTSIKHIEPRLRPACYYRPLHVKLLQVREVDIRSRRQMNYTLYLLGEG